MSEVFDTFNEGITASLNAHQKRSTGEFEAAAALDEEAVAIFDKVLAIEPNHEGALGGKGMCLALLGRIDEAIEVFELSLKVDEPFYEHHRQLALCYVQVGNIKAAWEHTAKAMELNDKREYRQQAAAEIIGFGEYVLQIIETYKEEMDTEQLMAHYQWAAATFALACETDDQCNEAKEKLAAVEARMQG